jgi:hypothetical protein|eukprot:SAG25_NODE_1263_length_3466_cov_2.420552_8_plen_46_part_00
MIHTRITPADVVGDRRTTARALAEPLYLLVKVGVQYVTQGSRDHG